MNFDKVIGRCAESEPSHITSTRTAVRAIILQDEKILMVRSNRGYFKLPGGGVESGESHTEALVREVAEETGFINCRVLKKLGTVSEHRPDQFSPDSFFQMDSHHFLCEVSNKERAQQSLIGYEQEEGYAPGWIGIQQAIDTNRAVYEIDASHTFIPRENYVLEWLQQSGVTGPKAL